MSLVLAYLLHDSEEVDTGEEIPPGEFRYRFRGELVSGVA